MDTKSTPHETAGTLTDGEREQLVLDHMRLVGYIVRETMARVPEHVSADDLQSAGLAALVLFFIVIALPPGIVGIYACGAMVLVSSAPFRWQVLDPFGQNTSTPSVASNCERNRVSLRSGILES